jgi:hypothetical protein
VKEKNDKGHRKKSTIMKKNERRAKQMEEE